MFTQSLNGDLNIILNIYFVCALLGDVFIENQSDDVTLLSNGPAGSSNCFLSANMELCFVLH